MALKTTTQRARLAHRDAPYWEPLDGVAGRLGFRKTLRTAGSWLVKWQSDGQRRQQAIGTAETRAGEGGLSYADAKRKAVQIIIHELAATVSGDLSPSRVLTVADAVSEYVQFLSRNRKASTARDATYRSEKYIHKDPLGRVKLSNLTKGQIQNWQDRLIPKRADDPEKNRRAKDTANRVLTILKAALNRAHQEGYVVTDAAWRSVKPFPAVGRARSAYLRIDQIPKLLAAAETIDPSGDSRRLFAAMILTGARPGELSSANRSDYDRSARTIQIDGKTGPRTTHLSKNCCELFDECLKCAKDKNANAPLVQRDGKRWLKQHWARALTNALQAADLPHMPAYALRHTHASAALNAGIPMKILAANLGTSVRMLETNYQKFGDFERKQASERIQMALDGAL
jgi:integrase